MVKTVLETAITEGSESKTFNVNTHNGLDHGQMFFSALIAITICSQSASEVSD